jgi:hypothetical protein
VMALFVMSLYWLPPVIRFAVTGGIMLLFCESGTTMSEPPRSSPNEASA